jgi:hypothetical protein
LIYPPKANNEKEKTLGQGENDHFKNQEKDYQANFLIKKYRKKKAIQSLFSRPKIRQFIEEVEISKMFFQLSGN